MSESVASVAPPAAPDAAAAASASSAAPSASPSLTQTKKRAAGRQLTKDNAHTMDTADSDSAADSDTDASAAQAQADENELSQRKLIKIKRRLNSDKNDNTASPANTTAANTTAAHTAAAAPAAAPAVPRFTFGAPAAAPAAAAAGAAGGSGNVFASLVFSWQKPEGAAGAAGATGGLGATTAMQPPVFKFDQTPLTTGPAGSGGGGFTVPQFTFGAPATQESATAATTTTTAAAAAATGTPTGSATDKISIPTQFSTSFINVPLSFGAPKFTFDGAASLPATTTGGAGAGVSPVKAKGAADKDGEDGDGDGSGDENDARFEADQTESKLRESDTSALNASGGAKVEMPDDYKTGEEDDKPVFKVKLRVYGMGEGSWTERGAGVLKINKMDGDRHRIVMRSDVVFRLLVNAVVVPSITLKRMNDKALLAQLPSEDGKLEAFLLRSSSKDDIDALEVQLNEAIAHSKKASARE